MKKLDKRTAAGVGVALLVLFLIIGIWLAARPSPDQIQGMIDTDEIRVAAKASGRVQNILVREGAMVKAGQPLFVLSNDELEAQLRGAHAMVTLSKAEQSKAHNGTRPEDLASALSVWKSEQATAAVAAKTAQRVSNLYAEGVASANQRDEAVAAAKATAGAAAAARAQYEKALAGVRVEDKVAVGAQVDQAAAAASAVSSLEEELKAVAPIDGQITQRFANVGEVVPPGFPVFSMIRPNDFWVSFNVREDQFSGLKIGKVLTGTVPALDGKKVQFNVYFINPQGDFATWRAVRQSTGYDVKAFEVRARPVGQVDNLRPGMSVLFDWPQR